MNPNKLKQEGERWVEDNIITEVQLSKILSLYSKKDPNTLITLFAILLTGLAFLTFMFSDWATVPHFSRSLIIVAFIVLLYVFGDFLLKKGSELLGVSFIVLGYIIFGLGLLLSTSIYNINLFSVWPFVVWSLVGLILYIIYEHRFLFSISIVITTIGQVYGGFEFGAFNWLIFILLLLGFAHIAYHNSNYLFSYLFALSYSIQLIVLGSTYEFQYYWLIIGFIILYILGIILSKDPLRLPLKYVSLASIFIFSIYQTFLLQETSLLNDLDFKVSFFIIFGILIVLGWLINNRNGEPLNRFDFILFLPIFYLPFAYLIGLAILFIYSIVILLFSYQQEDNTRIMIGTATFLLVTFTVYIQFAWETLDKSLFFLIGGMLLFIISFTLERKRRTVIKDHKGGTGK